MSLRSLSNVNTSMVLPKPLGFGVTESRSFIYTTLYKITSKYYYNTYINGPDGTYTCKLIHVYLINLNCKVFVKALY